MRDRRKSCASLSAVVLEEMRAEAQRQGRSLSWVAQRAWLVARARLRKLPAPPGGGR